MSLFYPLHSKGFAHSFLLPLPLLAPHSLSTLFICSLPWGLTLMAEETRFPPLWLKLSLVTGRPSRGEVVLRLFIPLDPPLWGHLGPNPPSFPVSFWAYGWWMLCYSLFPSFPWISTLTLLSDPNFSVSSKGFPTGILTEIPIWKVCGRRRNIGK